MYDNNNGHSGNPIVFWCRWRPLSTPNFHSAKMHVKMRCSTFWIWYYSYVDGVWVANFEFRGNGERSWRYLNVLIPIMTVSGKGEVSGKMASRSSGNVSIIGYLDYRIFTVTVLDTNAKVTIYVSLVVPIELLWRSWCPSEVDSPMPNRGLILSPALHWWNLLYMVFQQTRRMTLLHQQPSITKK